MLANKTAHSLACFHQITRSLFLTPNCIKVAAKLRLATNVADKKFFGSLKLLEAVRTNFFLLAIFVLHGCGGGGGGSSGTNSNPPQPQPQPPVTVLEGIFLDSPVEGLNFTSTTQANITDAQGVFTYIEGEQLTFSIGDIVLGTSVGKNVVTPLDLVVGAGDETDTTVTNIARLLQTIDDDADSTNGIQITAQMRTAAMGLGIDFGMGIAAFDIDPAVQLVVSILTSAGMAGPRALVSAETAQLHLRNSLLADTRVRITKIVSDQLAGVEANFFPNGAGSDGNAERTVTMGARASDLKAHMKAYIMAAPEDLPNVVVTLLDANGDELLPVGDALIDGSVATFSTDLESFELNYFRVAAAIDTNADGILNVAELANAYISDGRFRVVPLGLYNETRIQLAAGNWIYNVGTPVNGLELAVEFARSFLANDLIAGDWRNVSNVSIGNLPSDPSMNLEHNVGVEFTAFDVGSIRSYDYSSSSIVAEAIMESSSFMTAVQNTLSRNSSDVQTHFSGQPTDVIEDFSWPLSQDPTEPGQLASELFFHRELDRPLFLTFGKAVANAQLTATVVCQNSRPAVESVSVIGSLEDLYDYDYGVSDTPARMMFIVQAGFPTLGAGGHVFHSKVEIDFAASDITFNFPGLCIEPEPINNQLIGSWTLTTVNGQAIDPQVFLIWTFSHTDVVVTSDLDCTEINDYTLSGSTLTVTITDQSGTQCGNEIGDTFEAGPVTISGNVLEIAITDADTQPLTTVFIFHRIGGRTN